MLQSQFLLPIASKLVIDLFAGGGGASTGIEQALGRHVDIAVNHDPEAVALHRANHPQTEHYCCDVFEVDPLQVTEGRPVGLLWASPDCKHFSKAKGGKPVSKKIRGLAWVVIKWAKLAQPDVICLENVEEFQDWGPLMKNGMPDPARKGKTFAHWAAQLRTLGYKVEWKELRACDYGAPTIRKRLFLVARRDGLPIVWPKPTHAQKPAKGSGLKPWRTAAECIDWSIPAPSIFERSRELAPATMRRIAHGIQRYVLNNPQPFIVPITHTRDDRVQPTSDPLRTVTTAKRGEFALAVPTLIQTGYGERPGQAPRVPGLDKPLGTAVDGQKHALVAAFLAQHNTGMVGHHATAPVSTIVGKGCTQALVSASLVGVGGRAGQSRPRGVDEPMQTITAKGDSAVVTTNVNRVRSLLEDDGLHYEQQTSNLVKLRGTSNSAPTPAPLGTVSAGGWHHAEVRAFLIRYFGTDQDPRITEPLHTCTTKERDAVVTVDIGGEPYAIADIGMRMLQPRELYRAQGFPDTYIIERGMDEQGNWITLTKSAQVRMCGNSVCPPLSRAIVAANYSDAADLKVAA